MSVRKRFEPIREVYTRHSGRIAIHGTSIMVHLAGTDVVPRHPTLRGAAVAVNVAQSLGRLEEPRLAADREVEVAVVIGHDVAGSFRHRSALLLSDAISYAI
jgi:hypothetical protein